MPRFETGQIVHHLRYDYRGVVADLDPECKADDAWYFRNQSQPTREQPWYHVLVDGGRETYVAEDNLEPDDTGFPVDHPMVGKLFPTYHDGRYYSQSFN